MQKGVGAAVFRLEPEPPFFLLLVVFCKPKIGEAAGPLVIVLHPPGLRSFAPVGVISFIWTGGRGGLVGWFRGAWSAGSRGVGWLGRRPSLLAEGAT